MIKKSLVLSKSGFSQLLADELAARYQIKAELIGKAAVSCDKTRPLPRVSDLIFARQIMPEAGLIDSTDFLVQVEAIVDRTGTILARSNRQVGRWTLHVFAMDDNKTTELSIKLEKAVFLALNQQKSFLPILKRFVLADVIADQALPTDIIVQVYVERMDQIWHSLARLSSGLSPYKAGIHRMKARKGSPSRSSRKLDEAFRLLGSSPKAGESAVDLGASPGGWAFVLASEGARVAAVDHAELKLPKGKECCQNISHIRSNGLTYMPKEPVDWLTLDMVIGAHESLNVLDLWLRDKKMKRFIINVKLPIDGAWPKVNRALLLLDSYKAEWQVMKAKHLYHDRHEITLMGMLV